MAKFNIRRTILCCTLCLTVVISLSMDCIAALPSKVNERQRQSKAAPAFVSDDKSEPLIQADHRSDGVGFEGTTDPESASPKQSNVFADQMPKDSLSAPFENVPMNYIGPNYMLQSAPHRNMQEDQVMAAATNLASSQASLLANPYFQGIINQAQLTNAKSPSAQKPATEDSINDVFTNAFKKYNVKKYLLAKIFGKSHEDADEDENGFFSNKHLKRHGTAGVAAKVLGELIGIKIRESIEGLGKSVSEYAKDFTARNFVNLGQVFSRVLKLQ